MSILSLTITEKLAGLRLDRALATLPEIESRSRAAHLIKLGHVKSGARTLKSSYITTLGETFTISLPSPTPTRLLPYPLEIEILYEDSDVIVINKPAGLVMHPAAGHVSDTLVNVLIHHAKDLAMGFSEERPGLVHRLDKETSGVLVVAKNDFAQEALAVQFRERSVHRIYQAIVHGEINRPSGRIEAQLRRHPRDRKRFASGPEGKRAITHFARLKVHKGLSLLSCKLETGRTHQIRVHLSEMGHPIIGDKLYGARATQVKDSKLRGKIANLSRIGLHAAELGFHHPRSKEILRFNTPWPADMKDILQILEWP